jgi:hypothetical protein
MLYCLFSAQDNKNIKEKECLSGNDDIPMSFLRLIDPKIRKTNWAFLTLKKTGKQFPTKLINMTEEGDKSYDLC